MGLLKEFCRRRDDQAHATYSRLIGMRRADDTEFFHPAAERVRVQAQDLRGAARSIDNPT